MSASPSVGLRAQRPNATFLAFQALIVLLTIGGGALLLARGDAELSWQLAVWVLLVAGIELLPVPAWRGMQVALGFPILMAVGVLFPPISAALTAFLGSFDPRELKGETTFLSALFNRSQVALSVFFASATFHALADIDTSPAWVLVAAAMIAALVDYAVNTGLVTVAMSLKVRVRPTSVLRELRVGSLPVFLVSYLGLSVLGLALAMLFNSVSYWALPAFLAPLVFARQAFFRAQALEEAHKELQARETLLRQLSNTMAEERADERLQIAGYLHDDLAQILFRLSIQVDVARKLLDKQDVEALSEQLDKIRQSKQDTSDRVRALIRDLHRSPLGAKGLAEALESFTDEVGRDSGVAFHHDVEDFDLPAPIALLLYHVAREGVMNALKHAHATDIWVEVSERDGSIVLELRDNGDGFDTSQPGPEGHFGMSMMRERAQVGGGTFDVDSAPGRGTTITVRFPIALLQPATQADPGAPNGREQATGGTVPAGASTQEHASPDTSGTTASTDEGSRENVRA